MAKKQMRSLDAEQNMATAVASTTAVSGEPSVETELDQRSILASQPYLGRWETLVSTTNWEKGRIIIEWRSELKQNGAATIDYSDETWSRHVGGVTPQHVGRLRKVYERFGASYGSFPRLYWSHFLAARDWDDAEMWLEGASQSRWSVTQMRRTRWETMGADPQSEPSTMDLVSANDDEDYSPASQSDSEANSRSGPRDVSEGPRPDGPDFGDDESRTSSSVSDFPDESLPWEEQSSDPIESPFVKLPALPADIAEAVEQFKLAIIRHRADGWAEISKQDVVQTLDALRIFTNQ